MPHCKIHEVRFYKPEPRAIRCMALQKSSNKLAISRSDASIEIWNINKTWCLEKSIVPTVENFSIEGLKWCGNRLFSVGLHGLLIEYNLYKLSIEHQLVVTGESAHCLDVNKSNSLIAIGTEQGYLNLFKTSDNEVAFERFFDKQEGRIVCLKFDSTGEFIVSGSIDAIRIWNVQTGHAIHKMTTGRSESKKPTVVWCLEVTDDFTIISGDSRGKLTFWDGKNGSQLESYHSHKADILALCLTEAQDAICCAGVDPNIINYEKIVVGGNPKWVKSIQRKIHDHDVNALVICNKKLYSGGIDGYLACSFHPPKTVLKLPPILSSCASFAPIANYLLLRYPKHLEIWHLGKSEDVDASIRGILPLQRKPQKLAVVQKVAKNCDDDEEEETEFIICSCISSDGKWIFYSTPTGNRLLEFVMVDNQPNLLKVKDLEHDRVPCVKAEFSNDGVYLVTAPNTGGLYCYELQNGQASIISRVTSKDITDTITHLLISPCGKYLIAGDPSGNIVVWTFNKTKQQWLFYCKLPKNQLSPTAMALHPLTLNLYIAYSASKIVEYEIKKRLVSTFSKVFNNTKWETSYPINNIIFDPRANNVIIVQEDSRYVVFVYDKKSTSVQSNSPKSKKIESKPNNIFNNNKELGGSIEIGSTVKYTHLVHVAWSGDDEMVAVEVNPLRLIEQLPPAFLQNTFGKK